MKSTTEVRVRNYHIDHFGHVNHARYLELLEEGRWCYFEDNDLLKPLHHAGIGHVVAGVVVDYRRAARLGDILRIETEIVESTAGTFVVSQNVSLKASGQLAVEAMITNAFVDRNGQARAVDAEVLSIWPDLAASARTSDTRRS